MAFDLIARDEIAQSRIGVRRAQPLPTGAIIGDSIAAADSNVADRVNCYTPTANRLRSTEAV